MEKFHWSDWWVNLDEGTRRHIRESIIDDTSAHEDQPVVGGRWYGWPDTVEILAISPLLEHVRDGVTLRDRAIVFRVVEVHSPGDSELDQEVMILWGDMMKGCAYVRVERSSATKTEDLIPFLVG